MTAPEKVRTKWGVQRALARYRRFWAAIEEAGEAVQAAQKLCATAEESRRVSWSAPTPEDLRAAATKAARSVQIVAKQCKRWEAELVSREWVK